MLNPPFDVSHSSCFYCLSQSSISALPSKGSVFWKIHWSEEGKPCGKSFLIVIITGNAAWVMDRGCEHLSKGSPTDVISNFTDKDLAPEWRWALQSATSICKHMGVLSSHQKTLHKGTCVFSMQVSELLSVRGALMERLWTNKHSREEPDNNTRGKPRVVETDVGGSGTVGCTLGLFPKQWNMTTCVYPRPLFLSLYTHIHFLAASSSQQQHGSPPVSRPGFRWSPKRGSLGINSTEQCWEGRFFFFPLTKWGETLGEKSPLSAIPLGLHTERGRDNSRCPHAHRTPELFLRARLFFISLSSEITGISEGSNNRQLFFSQPSWFRSESVLRLWPQGENVRVWLQRSDALPASRCFMFPPARSLEEVRLAEEQGGS